MKPPSLHVYGRIAGFLYLLIIVFGLIAQLVVRDGLVDYDNATVTATNVMASEFLFRLGFASELAMLLCDTAVAMILYVLFRQVARDLAMLSIFFRLMSISILSVTALSHYAVVHLVGNVPYLNVFEPDQLNAMALFSIRLHGSGYNISLLFFGVHLIFLGYLAVNSGLFPKILGILLVIAGICYGTNSAVWFLFPAFVPSIYPGILIPSFVAELFLSLWLLFKGVKVPDTETD